MSNTFDFNFYKGKKVLVTGHTGFKGSWLCRWLLNLGAEVTGYALESPTEPDLFHLLDIESRMRSVTGDIRDLEKLHQVFAEAQPEIVLHLAAQPIVRESYKNPVYTYETNVMGTVNILEAVRQCRSVKSFLNVTTDKVYRNNEWEWGYRETDELDGYDPYSNSKSCQSVYATAETIAKYSMSSIPPAVTFPRCPPMPTPIKVNMMPPIVNCVPLRTTGDTFLEKILISTVEIP